MRHVPLSPGPDLEDDDDDDAAAAPAPAATAGTIVGGNNQTIAPTAPLAWPVYYRTTIPMNQLIQNVHRALDSIFVSSWAQFLIQTNKNALTINPYVIYGGIIPQSKKYLKICLIDGRFIPQSVSNCTFVLV